MAEFICCISVAFNRVSMLMRGDSSSSARGETTTITLYVRPSSQWSLDGTHVVSVQMSDDNSSDATEILPFYVVGMADLTGCISVA